MNNKSLSSVGIAVLVATSAVAWEVPDTEACGPWFPNQVLWNPDAVLDMPDADVEREAYKRRGAKAKGITFVPMTSSSPRDFTLATEIADLKAALKAQGMADNEIRGRVVALSLARERVMKGEAPGTTSPALPMEFQLYLEGAAHYRGGRMADASERWRALLALPPAQRMWRSTWAAFMLGKVAQRQESTQRAAAGHYQAVRAFVRGGLKDSLGLANTSLGWEARTAMARGLHAQAAALYVRQGHAGDPGAARSLELSLTDLFNHPDAVRRAVKLAHLRPVVSAWLTTQRGKAAKTMVQQWHQAHKGANIKEADSAKMLAWALYKSGDFAGTHAWLGLSPAKDPVTLWLRSKLALRDGDTKNALALVARAARSINDKVRWSGAAYSSDVYPRRVMLGEAGTLALSQRDFVGALDLLYRGGHWEDAAYVAERVLMLKELRRYVDKHWAAKDPKARQIRGLLARRMVRSGDAKGAAKYAAPETVEPLKKLIAHERAIRRLKGKKQAMRLWDMAKLVRHFGMELMGTEVYPDFTHYGGSFAMGDDMAPRLRKGAKGTTPSRWGASSEELTRAKTNTVQPEKRFHYRYRAAGIGWRVADKLKADTPVHAAVLCQAGSWLKARDPQGADPFYKRMVRDNPNVSMAQSADRRRWFPLDCGAP